LRIDEETGTTFWMDAIRKEMEKVKVAFEFCESWTPQQIRDGLARGDFVGYQEIDCHMIFDIKMDLTRKARFVAGGHTTETPTSITYSSVVSHDSVRIAFLIAALNDVDIMACDVSNAYLNAPCREKIWFVAGPEFGSRPTSGKDCACSLWIEIKWCIMAEYATTDNHRGIAISANHRRSRCIP
jgi:hypothetical protein